ncbi:hypothetical protein BJ508DRAFT_346304, partial [Ascobolus immersus RN42]
VKEEVVGEVRKKEKGGWWRSRKKTEAERREVRVRKEKEKEKAWMKRERRRTKRKMDRVTRKEKARSARAEKRRKEEELVEYEKEVALARKGKCKAPINQEEPENSTGVEDVLMLEWRESQGGPSGQHDEPEVQVGRNYAVSEPDREISGVDPAPPPVVKKEKRGWFGRKKVKVEPSRGVGGGDASVPVGIQRSKRRFGIFGRRKKATSEPAQDIRSGISRLPQQQKKRGFFGWFRKAKPVGPTHPVNGNASAPIQQQQKKKRRLFGRRKKATSERWPKRRRASSLRCTIL